MAAASRLSSCTVANASTIKVLTYSSSPLTPRKNITTKWQKSSRLPTAAAGDDVSEGPWERRAQRQRAARRRSAYRSRRGGSSTSSSTLALRVSRGAVLVSLGAVAGQTTWARPSRPGQGGHRVGVRTTRSVGRRAAALRRHRDVTGSGGRTAPWANPSPREGLVGSSVALSTSSSTPRSTTTDPRQASGTSRSISSSQMRADMSDGARQSPRGDNAPPDETLGPLGKAERLNWLNE